MTPLEIALLIGGALIFAISFIIPSGNSGSDRDIRKAVEDEVRKKIASELDGVKTHIDDVVDEAVDYAQEKTERSLERISNEKIMAVQEYSDTVLEEIDKNHKEVMFLYDMLNDKHDTLISTVGDAEKTQSQISGQTAEAKKVLDDSLKILEESRKNCDEAKDAYDKVQVIYGEAQESYANAQTAYVNAQQAYEDAHQAYENAHTVFSETGADTSSGEAYNDFNSLNIKAEAEISEGEAEVNDEKTDAMIYSEISQNSEFTKSSETLTDSKSSECYETPEYSNLPESREIQEGRENFEKNGFSDAVTEAETNEKNDELFKSESFQETNYTAASGTLKDGRAESEVKVRTLKWAAFAKQQADEALNENGQDLKTTAIDYPAMPRAARSFPYHTEKEKDINPQAQLHNEILTLHKLGQSDVEIARSLNMGVGEVALIIGIHGNDK